MIRYAVHLAIRLESATTPYHRTQARTEAAPKLDALEELVAKVWREVLGIATVHRHSNFVALGGESIRALQVDNSLRS